MDNLLKIREALEKAWCKETSCSPEEWSEQNPAWGQCAVSALVVRDFEGGSIRRGIVTLPNGTEMSHYWNNMMGVDVDLTWRQFPIGTTLGEVETRSAGILLDNESTKKRYLLLMNIVNKPVCK